jgi:drug/metabolite transporter (DMT)-like permease
MPASAHDAGAGMNRSVAAALAAAALFGASTPLAKRLVGSVDPLLLAGLLYAGSGIGLGIVVVARRLIAARSGTPVAALARADLPWLAAAIAVGGVAGPILLVFGLRVTPASSASLLLNFESVLTALVAWFVFREHVAARTAVGMLCIAGGGVALAWPGDAWSAHAGALLIVGACACWALDNNLTRRVSAGDALSIACLKGLVAGSVNVLLAAAFGAAWPAGKDAAAAALVGFFGYGVSLVLFIVALRGLGAGRSGAYFATAPFLGAAFALLTGTDALTLPLAAAGLLMAFGVWLHLTERHEHWHEHEALEHEHRHVHDAHHRHVHDAGWNGREPHSHRHVHARIAHAHPHYPDIHHRHDH